MRQVLQARSGATVVRDVPIPPCPAGGLLVRNEYSVISSGTERTIVDASQQSLLGKARERPDLVKEVVERARRDGLRATEQAVRRKLGEETLVGYSSAGRVIEVGRNVRGFRVGDTVACAGAGHANHAEVVAVPRNLCARVPDAVPLDSAAFTTIAAIALHGVRLADVKLGDRVAVIGCGLVGQIACRLLQAAGAETFAIDIDQSRVDQAVAGGATHGALAGPGAVESVMAATLGDGVDQIVVAAAAPSNEPLLLAGEIARDRAAVVIVGDVPVEVPRAPLFTKELSVRVSRSYGPGRYDADYEDRGLDYPIGYVRWTQQRNMDAILGLQARGRLTFRDLIDDVVPVADAADAYARLVGEAERRPRGALVLAYGSGEEQPFRSPSRSRLARLRTAATRTSDSPRIGLVGPGAFATSVIVPALTAAGARLEVVGGGSGPSAVAAQRDFGFKRVAASEQALVGDPDVDAVVIATRHGSHARLAREALEQGKHVFVEKPLALTLEDVHSVIDAASTSSGVLAVGFNRRFSPLFVRLRDHLRAAGAPVTGSFRVSAGDIPSKHWVHDLTEGGGRALGEVCHFVDTLAALAGSRVEEVHAVGHGAADLPAQAHDNLVISLRFAGGSVGTIVYVSDGSPGVGKERLEAFSGARTAILDDFVTLQLFNAGQTTEERLKAQDKGHRAEFAAFVDGMRRGSDPVPLAEVENVSVATIAVVESLRSGRPVGVEG